MKLACFSTDWFWTRFSRSVDNSWEDQFIVGFVFFYWMCWAWKIKNKINLIPYQILFVIWSWTVGPGEFNIVSSRFIWTNMFDIVSLTAQLLRIDPRGGFFFLGTHSRFFQVSCDSEMNAPLTVCMGNHRVSVFVLSRSFFFLSLLLSSEQHLQQQTH